MKILIIARGYPTPNHPLFGCFEATQAHALQKLGHEVIYIGLNFYSAKNWDIIGTNHRIVDGINIYEHYFLAVPYRRLMPEVIIHHVLKKEIIKLYKKVEKLHGKPDIIHSHYLNISVLASVLKKKFNIPWVCTEHWSIINNDILPEYVKNYGKLTYPYADAIITVSNSLALRLFQHWKVRSTVIYNMVSDAFFVKNTDTPNRLGFRFISVGNLIHRKGHDILIDAFKKADFDTNVSLTIVGGGNQRSRLQNMIDSAGLTARITLTGLKSQQEIQNLISESDVFVLASRKETFGVVYIEAMAKGLPVIATPCGGPEEFVNHENGLLVPCNRVNELTDALKYMHKNINEYNRDKIRESTLKKFSETSIAQKIEEVYLNILKKRHDTL